MKTKLMNSNFKVLSQFELNKVVGGDKVPVPYPVPCPGGESGSSSGSGGSMPISNGDSAGVLTGTVSLNSPSLPLFVPCSPPIIKVGPLL